MTDKDSFDTSYQCVTVPLLRHVRRWLLKNLPSNYVGSLKLRWRSGAPRSYCYGGAVIICSLRSRPLRSLAMAVGLFYTNLAKIQRCAYKLRWCPNCMALQTTKNSVVRKINICLACSALSVVPSSKSSMLRHIFILLLPPFLVLVNLN
jgi:hypothetical protein